MCPINTMLCLIKVNSNTIELFFCSAFLRDFSLWLDRLSGEALDTLRTLLCSSRAGSDIQKLYSTPGLG